MNDPQQAQHAQGPSWAAGPALPIIMTIVWLVVMVVVLMFALMSLMAFDSGSVTTGMGLLVAGIWLVVILCPVSVIAGWIAWGVSRRHVGAARIVRGVLYALPLIGIPVFLIGLAIG
jgi:hypothetical protein